MSGLAAVKSAVSANIVQTVSCRSSFIGVNLSAPDAMSEVRQYCNRQVTA